MSPLLIPIFSVLQSISLITALADIEHPTSSVTVSVYVPGARLAIPELVLPLDQLYV